MGMKHRWELFKNEISYKLRMLVLQILIQIITIRENMVRLLQMLVFLWLERDQKIPYQ